MSNEDNVYKKSETKPENMSRRFYSVAKSREPWYLKLIFWMLLIIFLGGGSVASFIIIREHRISSKALEALEDETDILKKLMTFENELLNEKSKISENKYEVAKEIAIKNEILCKEIEELLNSYFDTFNEDIDGYNIVIEYEKKFETLKKEFNELNKDDPRLLKDNLTQPY